MDYQTVFEDIPSLFDQPDRTHLGNKALFLLLKAYPHLSAALYFYVDDRAEFILHSRRNAGRRFPGNQGIAGRVLAQGHSFSLTEIQDDIEIIPEIDTPGCSDPVALFSTTACLHNSPPIVLSVYSEHPFPEDFDTAFVTSFVHIITKADCSIATRTKLLDFSNQIPSIYALAVEQRSSCTLGLTNRLQSYISNIVDSISISSKNIASTHLAAYLQFTGQIGGQDTPEIHDAVPRQTHLLNKSFVSQLVFPEHIDKVPTIIKQLRTNYDGTGEPLNLNGNKISLGARIIRLVNLFEFFLHKSNNNTDAAIALLQSESNKSLDPDLVAIFIDNTCYKIINRSSKRVDLDFPVDIKICSEQGSCVQHGIVRDMSESGLKIDSEALFEIDDVLELILHFPGRSTSALAMVVRKDQQRPIISYGLHLLYQQSQIVSP